MIKKVKIQYPEFGLDNELEFKKGINIVEKPNMWGKTVMLNTIMSLYTGYFGRISTLPNGFASIETDKGTFNLVKKTWIGSIQPDPLSRYAIVGAFFNDTKSTVEQRAILTKFLGIDLEDFIKNYIENFKKTLDKGQLEYYKDLELGLDLLKQSLKEAKVNEKLIIDDITRLRGDTLSFKEEAFDDVKNYNDFIKDLELRIAEHNKSQSNVSKSNNEITSEKNKDLNRISIIKRDIESCNNDLERFRTEYLQLNSTKCFNCGNDMLVPKEKLDALKTKGEETKSKISKLEIELKELETKKYKDLKETKYLQDYAEAVKFLKIKPVSLDPSRLQAYEEYNKNKNQLEFTKKELGIKEKQLAAINTVQLEDCISIYLEATEKFNKDLEEKIKTTGLNIELFETQKNGNIKQTFNIYNKDGKEYSQCSSGEKLVIQIKLALLFIDKFGFDFVLVDESSILGKDNFEILKGLLKDYQVILFKADQWGVAAQKKPTK